MNINNRPLCFDAEFCDIPAKKVSSMKRLSIIIIIAIAAIVAAGVTVKAFMRPIDNSSTVPDKQGHVFIHQWKTYYDAVSADRPKKQIEALDAIKKIARDRRVAWDFWDASVKYFDVSVSRDWKSRDSLISRMEREVKEFDEPVMTILYRRSYLSTYDYELLKYITEDAARLEKAKNEPFYKHEGHICSYMSGQLPEYIRNDFEYLLWINLPSYGNSEGLASDRTYKMLDSIIKGRYPDGAYLRYLSIAANPDDGKREAALILLRNIRVRRFPILRRVICLRLRKILLTIIMQVRTNMRSCIRSARLLRAGAIPFPAKKRFWRKILLRWKS